VERDLDLEVRGYVEMLERTRFTTGMRRDEAHRAALLELGGVEQVKEQVREVRIGNLLENLWQDLPTVAGLSRGSRITAVAVVSLALGSAALRDVQHRQWLLLQPLPTLRRPSGPRDRYYPKRARGAAAGQPDHGRCRLRSGSEFNLTGKANGPLVGSTYRQISSRYSAPRPELAALFSLAKMFLARTGW